MEPEGSLPHSQVPTNCPYLEPFDPIHALTPHLLKIHLNIILPFTPASPKRPLPLRFPHQNTVYASPLSPIRATCPAHLIILDLITRTTLDEQYRSLRSSLYSFLHSSVTPPLFGPIILLNTLFSNTLNSTK